jgi:hypothetical protein
MVLWFFLDLYLHPCPQLVKWVGQLRKYQTPMKKALQKLHDDKYKPQSTEEEQTEQQEGPDFLDSYLEDILPGAILEDQYTSYAFGPQTPILSGTLYEHWSKESAIPAIQQIALSSPSRRRRLCKSGS